jgi:hypothetical protein
MSDVRPLEVTEEMCVCALAAVYNFKCTRYGLLPLSLENIKASEGTHWALLMEETLVALQAALAVPPRDKGEPRTSFSWQPIETAPHDEVVLLYWKDWADREYMDVTRASTGQRYPNGYSDISRHGYATHWAPLPPPPSEAPPPSQDTDNELAGNGLGMR